MSDETWVVLKKDRSAVTMAVFGPFGSQGEARSWIVNGNHAGETKPEDRYAKGHTYRAVECIEPDGADPSLCHWCGAPADRNVQPSGDKGWCGECTGAKEPLPA